MGRPVSDQQIQAAVATFPGQLNHAVITFDQFVALMQLDLPGIPDVSSALPPFRRFRCSTSLMFCASGRFCEQVIKEQSHSAEPRSRLPYREPKL